MRLRFWLAAAVLLTSSVAARAEHFQYSVSLKGTYSEGGTEGCFPPEFNQPACPRAGFLNALLSFDTPGTGDGAFAVTGGYGDITDFLVTLGGMPGDDLYGGVEILDGVANGTVQTLDGSEYFSFDWASRTASYSYDFGYHNPNGAFSGLLSSVPEPASLALVLIGLAGVVRHRSRRSLDA